MFSNSPEIMLNHRFENYVQNIFQIQINNNNYTKCEYKFIEQLRVQNKYFIKRQYLPQCYIVMNSIHVR